MLVTVLFLHQEAITHCISTGYNLYATHPSTPWSAFLGNMFSDSDSHLKYIHGMLWYWGVRWFGQDGGGCVNILASSRHSRYPSLAPPPPINHCIHLSCQNSKPDINTVKVILCWHIKIVGSLYSGSRLQRFAALLHPALWKYWTWQENKILLLLGN